MHLKMYVKYFDRQVKKALEPKTILKADPKHAWIENLGVLGIGANAKSGTAADLAEQNIRVRAVGEDSQVLSSKRERYV